MLWGQDKPIKDAHEFPQNGCLPFVLYPPVFTLTRHCSDYGVA